MLLGYEQLRNDIASQLGLPTLTSVGFVHAHPDDETLATGALIAALSAAGVDTHVLTATRGERGEAVPGSVPPETTAAQLAEVREAELSRAIAILGVKSHAWLGSAPALAGDLEHRYTDSGMRWITHTVAGPAATATPDSFTSADQSQSMADLAAWIGAIDPDLVISYAADGGYGHPDHVLAHQVTKAAAQRCGVRFAESQSQPGPAVRWFDLAPTRAVVTQALRAYRTQLRVIDTPGADSEIEHVGGQREPVLTAAGLRFQ